MRIALLSNPSSGRGRHAAADDVARLTEHRLGEGSGADGRSNAEGVRAIEQAVRLVVRELGSPVAASEPGSTAPGGALSERALAGLAESRGEAGWSPVIGFGGAPFITFGSDTRVF